MRFLVDRTAFAKVLWKPQTMYPMEVLVIQVKMEIQLPISKLTVEVMKTEQCGTE